MKKNLTVNTIIAARIGFHVLKFLHRLFRLDQQSTRLEQACNRQQVHQRVDFHGHQLLLMQSAQ